jgi:hypothetical protein
MASATAARSQHIIASQRVEEEWAGRESVGDDDVGARIDVVAVDFPDDVGMAEVGLRTPGATAHRHAPPLDIGAGPAIKNDDFAA